jgi:hypothetical protein
VSESELLYLDFKTLLREEMERIDFSYKDIYGNISLGEIPTATTYTNLYLSDELPWISEELEDGSILKYIKAASAPSRDFFLSPVSSAVYKLRLEEPGLSCHTMVGLLFISIYMSSFQHFYAIVEMIRNDTKLKERIKSDLPGTYWEVSEQLFPDKFWGGKLPRFSSSALTFKKVFVDNQFNFEMGVGELKELLKMVNTTDDKALITAKLKQMASSSSLPGLNVFRLQLFIPLAALCGLVLPPYLFHADYIEPSYGIVGGSFSALLEAGFPTNRHQDVLLNICGHVGLPRRHSLGECLVCESHRKQKRYDMFQYGQDLFHLFLLHRVYTVKLKMFNSNEWKNVEMIPQSKLHEEDLC